MAPLLAANGDLIYPAFNKGVVGYEGPFWFGLDKDDPWWSSYVRNYPNGFYVD